MNFFSEYRFRAASVLLLGLALLAAGCSIPRPGTGLTENGVCFVIRAPLAEKVAVVGDFNRWDRDTDLLAGPDERGFWSATIALEPGRYEYLFLINNTIWIPDPSSLSVEDGLGGTNSVIHVGKPD